MGTFVPTTISRSPASTWEGIAILTTPVPEAVADPTTVGALSAMTHRTAALNAVGGCSLSAAKC
ncbi:MAG TPA: hypothetical protein VES01_02210 [Dermatophilaceae bacterium]|nr:hypothetical protein [Dermatophilaceae bacterium]